MSDPKEGDLRVWHVPQVGMKYGFSVNVPDLPTAARLLVTLSNYDLHLLKNNLRTDYANINGLEIFQDGEWQEWIDENGYDINDHIRYAKA